MTGSTLPSPIARLRQPGRTSPPWRTPRLAPRPRQGHWFPHIHPAPSPIPARRRTTIMRGVSGADAVFQSRPERRVGARLSRAQDVVDCVAVHRQRPVDSRPGCIFMHRPRRREPTILPHRARLLGEILPPRPCHSSRSSTVACPPSPPDHLAAPLTSGWASRRWRRSGRTLTEPPNSGRLVTPRRSPVEARR